ncbi:hypothetical protein SAMN06265375_1011586 [Muriicola jejuensis]|uniref:Lipocalin-like domain-containing protein n=1 Tax=Muriicola jejuensis TaxID=504488 RepID=A0A6P0UFQ7_9FLAO|nr:hypothetical protein [Muriicola jejuensis]NER08936.1 hypothetical protein [Muriicola jejuensis]SMP12776.1 hypothetical protein SAMN06265375_1011586 [Muriicola jejuensis]
MRNSANAFLLGAFLAIFLAFSCDNTSGEDPNLVKEGFFDISELAGNWEATQAQFSVSTVSVDIVEDGGRVTMTVQTSGGFTLTLNPVDRPAYTVSGEMFWEKWEGTYYFAIVWDDYPDDWDTYGHTWDGATLTLNGGADTGEYDFDNDGVAESCTLHFDFVRI